MVDTRQVSVSLPVTCLSFANLSSFVSSECTQLTNVGSEWSYLLYEIA